MQALFYYICLPFFYFLSILSFPVLYEISNLLFFLLYKIIKYRKEVVLQNLKNSFPQKSEEEILKICQDYYKHLCDLFVETIKMLSINPKDLAKRSRLVDVALFNRLHAENKNIIVVMGHNGNWEWAGPSFSLQTKYLLLGVYKPLSNKHFEKLMTRMRTRFNTTITPMNNTLRSMAGNKNILSVTAFIADQIPSHDNVYWTNFLNQDTAFFVGPERIAKKYNYSVVFINMVKVRRGFYEIHGELLFDNPSNAKDNEVTEMFVRKLEQKINNSPDLWLWSHRRWKNKKRK